MKKQLSVTCFLMVICVFLLSTLASCTVDDRYSMSNKIDATIGIGKGLTLPFGSTTKNYISDLLDVSESEFMSTDAVGNIVVSSGSSFASESFKIDEMSLSVNDVKDVRNYNFKVRLIEGMENLPFGKFPYVIYENIDMSSDFNVRRDDLPKEVTRLTKIFFKEPVPLYLFVTISSKKTTSQNLLKDTEILYLKGADNKECFELYLPDYLVFDQKTEFENGVLTFDGEAIYDEKTKNLCFEDVFYVESIDFTKTEKGYYEIVDGKIDLNEDVRAYGVLKSGTRYFDENDLSSINDVDITTILQVGEMNISSIECRFEPEIDPFSEKVDLNVGDVEFLKNAYIDVNDPRLELTIDNGLDVTIQADANIVGCDENGAEIDNTRMEFDITVQPEATTKILVDRYGTPYDGWTNCVVPNLNELIKNIPDKVGVDLSVGVDNSKDSRITLGEEIVFAGSYNLVLPLIFDDLRIEYSYSIEDVLGNNSDEAEDDYDYGYGFGGYEDEGYHDENYDSEDSESFDTMIKEIRGLSLSFNVLNTIPLGIKPEILMYKKNGELLTDVALSVEGEIKPGNYVGVDGAIGEPVSSFVKFKLSAQPGLLDELYRIDIKLVATGKGAFNVNEYIQLTDIAVKLDDYIVLDLNDNIQ